MKKGEKEKGEANPIELESGSVLDRPGLLLALAMLSVAVAYSAAPLGGFVWDDVDLILDQRIVRDLQPITSYFDRMFFGGPAGAPTRAFYRPLVVLSFALDWKIWGGSPLGFHLTNLALHLGATALVFALARRWGARPLDAALAATLFGLLPRLSEAVAWISGRTDLLAAVLVLSALWIHRQETGRRWLAATLLLFGLLSKEVAIAGFVALGVLEIAGWRRGKDGFAGLIRILSPYTTALLVYFMLRLVAQSQYLNAAMPIPVLTRVLIALETVGTYVWMVIDPLRPRTQIGALGAVELPMVILGIVALIGFAWLLRQRKRTGRFSEKELVLACLVGVPIALVLHLVPLPLNVVAADRFLYLPAAAVAIGLGAAAGSWTAGTRRLIMPLGALMSLAFAGATYLRTLDWQDEHSLWSQAVLHRPEKNTYPLARLAEVWIHQDRPEEAISLLEEARRIETLEWKEHRIGSEHGSLASIGLARAAMEDLDEAEKIFVLLAEARSFDPTNLYNLAVVRGMDLKFLEAKRDLRSILDDYPDHELALARLELFDEMEARWGTLPPPSSTEPVEVALARAEIYWELGRSRTARQIWTAIASSPGTNQRAKDAASVRLGRGAER